MTDDLITYELVVRDLASTRSEKIFYNSGYEHATIVMENMFLEAKREIKMLTGSFNGLVCDDAGERFISALKTFLLGKGKLKAIMNEYEPSEVETNSILSILRQYSGDNEYRENIQIRITSRKLTLNNFDVHFLIADSSMYRLEYDTKKFLAEFSFKGKERAGILQSHFDRMFEESSVLSL